MTKPTGPGPCDDCGTSTARKRGRLGRYCISCMHARRRARYRRKNQVRRAPERMTDLTAAQERELRAKAKRCPMPGCGTRLTDEPYLPNSKELDHIIPINIGGTHTLGNVRIICRACNRARPNDGSDYIGQPTLWSAINLGAPRRRTPQPKPKPIKSSCSCGQTKRAHDPMCSTCRGNRAAILRSAGLKWQDIANQLGYASAGAAMNATKNGS